MSAKQIAGDILLAAIILLVLMTAMGLMSDYDAEALNRQVLKEAQQRAITEQQVRDRKIRALNGNKGQNKANYCAHTASIDHHSDHVADLTDEMLPKYNRIQFDGT